MGSEVSWTHKSSDSPASVSEPFKINGFFCLLGKTFDLLFRKKERRQSHFSRKAELEYFSLNGLESEFPALISREWPVGLTERRTLSRPLLCLLPLGVVVGLPPSSLLQTCLQATFLECSRFPLSG